MAKMKIETMALSDLKEYANNPRRNTKAVNAVLESIKKFGFNNPILINKDNVILAGHTRIEALRKTGALNAEVIRLTHMTEEQERAFRIADNRTAEFSKWDQALLDAGMKKIDANDWEKFGFSKTQIERLAAPGICKCPKCGKEFVKV